MNDIDILHPDSRVWLYHSSRVFSNEETEEIKKRISDFTKSWVSHNQSLKAHGDLLYNRFALLLVDETSAGASGCSIDTSVHFMQALGHHYQADFFNRMNFAYKMDDNVHSVPANDFRELYSKGEINDHTQVFDNLVKTKGEFEDAWIKPLHNSWLKRFV